MGNGVVVAVGIHNFPLSNFTRSINMYVFVCYSESVDGGPSAKKQKMDDNLEGGMQDITKAKVTEVS